MLTTKSLINRKHLKTKYQQKMTANLVLKKLLQFTLENKINYKNWNYAYYIFAQPSFNTNEAPAIAYRIYLIRKVMSPTHII